MTPKVSIVITSTGRSELKYAIDSAKNQTYDNVEVIVVLDGKIPSGIDSNGIKIIYLDNVRNGNISRNIGIKEATGDFIALLDDDDVFYPQKIEKQIEQIQNEKDGNEVVSYTKVKMVSPGKPDTRISPNSEIKANEKVLDYLFRRINPGFMQTSTLLAHRSIFLNNLFDETVAKHQDWDWLINIQNKLNVRFLMVDEILVEYRINGLGTSVGTQNKWRYSLNWFAKYENITSEETKARFMSMIITNTMNDQSISRKQRLIEALRILREIPIKYIGLWLKSLLKIIYYF